MQLTDQANFNDRLDTLQMVVAGDVDVDAVVVIYAVVVLTDRSERMLSELTWIYIESSIL